MVARPPMPEVIAMEEKMLGFRMLTVAGLAMALAVSSLQLNQANAQTQGCREGCPKGYVWDGCRCR